MSLYLTAVANVQSRSDPTVARAFRRMQDERELYEAVRAAGAPKSVINAQRKAFARAEREYSGARADYRHRAIRRGTPPPKYCIDCTLPLEPGENPCKACGRDQTAWILLRDPTRTR